MTKKVYSGYGVEHMLSTAWRHGLTKQNSVLRVKDKNDINSKWTITVKEQ